MRRRLVPALLLCAMLAAWPALGAGKLSSIGEGDDKIAVLVVSGTPYEMGYAYGKYLAPQIKANLTRYLGLAQMVQADRCSNEKLDAAWETVAPYVSLRFRQEMAGLADGSGLPLEQVRRAHCISLVNDYSCSGVAAWGAASANGHLYQIRNLDFSTQAGLQDYPVIVVYRPKEGFAHAVVSFAGYIGCMAGMNAAGVSLTEKGASPGRDYPYDLDGAPFFAMFRDILYDADSLQRAVSLVQNVKRHKKYYYVIGDGDDRAAVKMHAFAPDLKVIEANDPAADENGVRVKPGLVYITMDNDKAWQHIQANYGKYDAGKMVELSRLVQGRENLVNVVYDATSREMWVAYAQGSANAATRPYVHFRLGDYVR